MLVASDSLERTIFVAGTAAISLPRGETQVAALNSDEARAFYAAEGAVEWGSDQLHSLLKNALDPTQDQFKQIAAPSIPGFQISNYHIQKVGSVNVGIDQLRDYYRFERLCGSAIPFRPTWPTSRPQHHVSREIHTNYSAVSVCVFYEKDLEIFFPGADMTFAGPIPHQRDLYMGA